MKLTPKRKKLLLAAGAAILLVVVYLRVRGGGSVTDSGAPASGVDPNAIDPATGLTYGQEQAAATGSLASGSLGGSGGFDTGAAATGPDPTTLAALEQLGQNQQSIADQLGQLGAELGNALPSGATAPGSDGGFGAPPNDHTSPPDVVAPPRSSGPKVLGTIAGSPYVGVETLASGAKLYTTTTGVKIEQASGKSPYRVSGGSGLPTQTKAPTATKAVKPTSPSHPAAQATAAQVKKAVAASAPGGRSAPPRQPGRVLEG